MEGLNVEGEATYLIRGLGPYGGRPVSGLNKGGSREHGPSGEVWPDGVLGRKLFSFFELELFFFCGEVIGLSLIILVLRVS